MPFKLRFFIFIKQFFFNPPNHRFGMAKKMMPKSQATLKPSFP